METLGMVLTDTVASMLRRMMPRSLRGQFALALSVLALLILAGAMTAVYTLRMSNRIARQLTEERLVRMQDVQDLLEHTVLIERSTYQLLTTGSLDAVHSNYADIVEQLNTLDRLVRRVGASSEDLDVLDLQQSSQLFRSTTNIVAQLRESTLRTEVVFSQTLKARIASLQAAHSRKAYALANVFYRLDSANRMEDVKQLRSQFETELRTAGSLPEPLRTELDGPSSTRADGIDPGPQDLFSLRMKLVNEYEVLLRFHDELQTQSIALALAARRQSSSFTLDYREAVQGLVDVSDRNQQWVLALLACSLTLAWLIAYLFMGRHVLVRLRGISWHLRQESKEESTVTEQLTGVDEIDEMANAVEQLLKDRNQLKQRTTELSVIKERLGTQNTHLQHEAIVRSQAEQEIVALMTEQKIILDNIGVGIAFLVDRRIVRCNHSFATMFGYQVDDLTGVSTDRLHPSNKQYQENGDSAYAAIELEGVHAGDIQLKRRDGTVFWVERTLISVDRPNLSKGAIWVVHDIDQRKRAGVLREEQGRVLEMIAMSTPLNKVLDSLARLVESQLTGMAASVLLLDVDGVHMRHGAAPSLPDAYVQILDGTSVGPKVGSCGTAIYRGEPVIVDDILQDPLWEDYRTLAETYGFRACWSTPILSHHGKVMGTFALYAKEVRKPAPIEIQMIDIATRIAGIAIERKSTEDSIRHMALHDALTGLPNRVLLEERIQQALLHSDRDGRWVAVVFLDLDQFKLINDSLGHSAGDELLKTVADRMVQCVRSIDTVARLGGDEFVIVLFDAPDNMEGIAHTLQRIQHVIAQPLQIGAQKLQVTCSMGVSTYPENGTDIDTLLMNADAAMYSAKDMGRNNYQFYASEMNAKVQEKLVLQDGLRRAIEHSEFLLLYQPQVDLLSGRIIGVEALIRWQHPELGVISPNRFIPLAEETGLIVPIGEWVLRTACKQNKAWQDAGMPLIRLSVNVSARQFAEKNLTHRVARALEDSGLDACYLELELTESLIMQDVPQAIVKMEALQTMGVQMSIDDFGTGYSSLSALKQFPVCRLKIDQSFIRDVPTNPDDKAIAMAVISLGHMLNLKVIAEGVETEQQLAFLRENECDEAQGYLFSRPVSSDEIVTLLLRAPWN
jgi:diguanylate cyclase (GGDEF)-like protein/PAS domain S-box-containing protein